MKSVLKGMNLFIGDLNAIISLVLLVIVYFVGVGLTSIVAKAFGKYFLEIKQEESYWSDLNLKEKPMGEYYKQF